MSIVTGEIVIEFSDGATVLETTITRDIDLGVLSAPTPGPIDLWAIVLDLPALITLYGPVSGIEWGASVTAVGLPGTLVALASACVVLAWRVRAR